MPMRILILVIVFTACLDSSVPKSRGAEESLDQSNRSCELMGQPSLRYEDAAPGHQAPLPAGEGVCRRVCQDPVPETTKDAIIGAQCSCPTRLGGFAQPPEPYDITHHHANRGATAQTIWREGQRITCADVLSGNDKQPTKVLVSAGTVLGNGLVILYHLEPQYPLAAIRAWHDWLRDVSE